MAQVGRKLYYELSTGNVIVNTGELSGYVVETTTEQDYTLYSALKDKDPAAIGCLQLDYGQNKDDFNTCNGYKIVDGQVQFSYPDPQAPTETPTYRPSLSAQVVDQEQRLSDVELALADLFTA